MKSLLISYFLTTFCINLSSQSTKQSPRIIYGLDADIKDIPYQVQILESNIQTCGGTIVTKKHVVSAAHCFEKLSPRTIVKIIAGTNNRGKGGVTYDTEKIISHPNYDSVTVDFDVAVVKILKKFNGPNMMEIPLTDVTDLKSIIGQEALVSGWGYLKDRTFPDRLQKLYVPILKQEVCEKSYTGFYITDRMFCAGYLDATKDACTGDSGGPIVLDGKLLGIVSWGIGCATLNRPGVYSFVPKFKDWIQEQIKKM